MTDTFYPLALYRDGDQFAWDGRGTDRLTVADRDAHEQALADGWREAADFLSASPAEKSLLDLTAPEIAGKLPDLSIAELEKLKADESAGKTRKGVLKLIDVAIDEKLKA